MADDLAVVANHQDLRVCSPCAVVISCSENVLLSNQNLEKLVMMNTSLVQKIALLSAFSVMLPMVAAAEPSARLEKSANYATDNTFKAYSVPTIDLNGKVKFLDVSVTLEVGDDGNIAPTAQVTSALSPSITTKQIQPGNYKSLDGKTTCTVKNLTLTNGRVQSELNCLYLNGPPFTVSIINGRISSGHPFLSQLLAQGVDKISDVSTQT